MEKKKLLMWLGIIAASCAFSLAMIFLGIEGTARATALTLWLVATVAVYAGVTLSDGRKTVKKIQEANLLFTEKHDADAYIAALNALLETEKGLHAQQVLRINLTVGYCDKRDYASALAALQAIPRPEKLNKANAAFYWVNLALCNFYLGNDDEGMRIVKLQQKAFEEMRRAQQTGPALAFLEIFELLYNGCDDDAAALLETARVTWENERTAADFAFMAQKCGVELQPLPKDAPDDAEADAAQDEDNAQANTEEEA